MQAIPLPVTTTALNPDGTIASTPPQPPTPTGGGEIFIPSVPSNPTFVPTAPLPVPPITVTTSTTNSPAPSAPPPVVQTTPNIILAQPYVDPPGTTRIYKTEDAYQIFPEELDSYIYTYALGTDAAPTRASFLVKNLCTQHTLGVTLNLPQFLVTSIDNTFLLAPLASQSVDLVVNETASINLIEQRKSTYVEPIVISVEVLNVTGPVYVQAPGFILPPPRPTNGETINTPSGPIFIPDGLPPVKRNLLLSQSLVPTTSGIGTQTTLV